MENGGDKGKYLVEFLRQARLDVKRILFVDDKIKNVESVESSLSQTNFQHTSFRYGAADPRVKSFDTRIAGLEWSLFLTRKSVISDREAQQLLNRGVRANPPAMSCISDF